MVQINKRFILAWLLGIPLSYFLLGFLGNFYTSGLEFISVSIVIHSLVTLFGDYLLGRLENTYRSDPTDTAIYTILAITLAAFLAILTNMALRFPNVFDRSIYQIEPGFLVYFFIGLATRAAAFGEKSPEWNFDRNRAEVHRLRG